MSGIQLMSDEERQANNDSRMKSRFPSWKRILCAVALFLVFGTFVAQVAPNMKYRSIGPFIRISSIPKHRRIHPDTDKRIIVMGDVHGMYQPMKKLLTQLEFDPERDQLIFTGDFTTKGPDSIKILDKAIEWNAACVRGNHEDDILRLYASLRKVDTPKTFPPYASETLHVWGESVQASISPTHGPTIIPRRHPHPTYAPVADKKEENDLEPLDNRERDIKFVRKLKSRHIAYLEQCPAIMELGKITEDGEKAVVVHGGLEWHVKHLEEQLPEVILRIRDLLPKDWTEPVERPTDDSRPWFESWNKAQKHKPRKEQIEVVYGHAASMGLQIHDYTLGLDSKCERGEKLSAMVFSTTKKGHYKQKLYQVGC